MSPETEEPDGPGSPKRREIPPETEEELLLRERSARDYEWWKEANEETRRRLAKFLWASFVVVSLGIGVAAIWVGVSIKPPPDYFPGHDRWSWVKWTLIIFGLALPIWAIVDGAEYRGGRSGRLAARIVGHAPRLSQLGAEGNRYYPGYDLDLMYGFAKVWYVPAAQLAMEDIQSLQAIKPDPDQQGKVYKLDRAFRDETMLDVGELFYHQSTYIMRVRSIGLSAVYVEVARPVTTCERWEKQWKSLSKRQRANLSA